MQSVEILKEPLERRSLLKLAMAGVYMLPVPSLAQKPLQMARVGWLGWTGAPGVAPSPLPLAGFREGLAQRGWIEGRNLQLETFAGDTSKSRQLMESLLQGNVDVVAAQGPMIFGARNVAGKVPLVFCINGDPVEAGLVTSLARPGGNLTGVTSLSADLSAKRLELAHELAPRSRKIAAIANQSHPGVQTEFNSSMAAARKLGIDLTWHPVHGASEVPPALEAIARSGAGAVIAIPDNLLNQQAQTIAQFALKQRIPCVSGWAEFVEAGNVLSYGPVMHDYYRNVALLVDKILRGVRPESLPVEQPTEFELVINQRVARTIGLTIPQSIVVRADRTVG